MFFKRLLTVLFVIALSLTLGAGVLAQDSTPDDPSPQNPILDWLDDLLNRADANADGEALNPFLFYGRWANTNDETGLYANAAQTVSRDFADRSANSAEFDQLADRLENAVSTWKEAIQRHSTALENTSSSASTGWMLRTGWMQHLIERLENAAASDNSWISRLNLSALKHLKVTDILR